MKDSKGNTIDMDALVAGLRPKAKPQFPISSPDVAQPMVETDFGEMIPAQTPTTPTQFELDKGKQIVALDAEYDQLQKAYDAKLPEWNKERDAGRPMLGGMYGMPVHDMVSTPKEQKDMESALTELRIARNKLHSYTKDQLEQDQKTGTQKSRTSQFWDGFTGQDFVDVATLGWDETGRKLRQAAAIEKLNRGEKLTPGEDALVYAFRAGQAADQYLAAKGGNTSWAGVGEGVSASIPFMAQVALTGGTGGIVKLGANAAVKKGVAGVLKRGALKTAEMAANAALQAPLTSSPYTNYAERTLEQYDVDLNDKGQLTATLARPTSEAQRSWQGFATGFSELFSERFGNVLPTGQAIGNFIKGVAPKVLGKSVGGALAKGVDALDGPAAQQMHKWLRKVPGYNGTAGEFAEELANNVIEPVLTGEVERIPENFSSENLWQTAMSVAIMGGMMETARVPAMVMDAQHRAQVRKEAQTRLNTIQNQEIKQLLTEALAASGNEERAKRLSAVDWNGVTAPEAAAAMDYVELRTYGDLSGGIAEAMQEQKEAQRHEAIFKALANKDTGNLERVTDAEGNGYFLAGGSLEETGADGVVFVKNPQTGEISQRNVNDLTRDRSQTYEEYTRLFTLDREIQAAAKAAEQEVQAIREEAEATGVDPTPAIATYKGIDLNNLAGQAVSLDDGTRVYVSQVSSEDGRVRIDVVPLDQAGEIAVDDNSKEMHVDLDVSRIATPDPAESTEQEAPVGQQEIQTGQTVTLRDGSQYMAIVSRNDQGGVQIMGVNLDEVSAGAEERMPLNRDDIVAVDGMQMGQQAEAASVAPTEQSASNLQIGRSLTEEEATDLLSRMEEQSEIAPEVELNAESWSAVFDENNSIQTPLGRVKMGENQIAKFFAKGREKEFGMVAPTLSNPDVIIEKAAQANDAERDSKYLFIKTFIKPDGVRFSYFESVTVRKDGLEVSVSSHEADEKAVKKEMQNGKILHLNERLSFGSEWYLTETPIKEEPDLVPTSDNLNSVNKDTNSTPNEQENVQDIPRRKDGTPDYDQISDPTIIAAAMQSEFGEDALSVAQESLAEAREKLDQAGQIKKAIERKRAQVNASKEIDKWEQALVVLNPAPIAPKQAEKKADPQSRNQRTTLRQQSRDLGDYLSLEDKILRDIAEGQKFRWTGNGSQRGLATELGFTDSPGERKARFNILANGGITVDQYAERLEHDMDNGAIPFDWDTDVRSAVLDVLSRVRSNREAFDAAVALREPDPRSTMTDEEAQTQAEYDQARRRMNEDVAEELAESNTGMGDLVTDDMHKRAPGVITVREQSDSNTNNNFIQHYEIDGRPSGVYGIYDIEAGPNTEPVSFGLKEFSFRSENWDELESLYDEHRELYPDIRSWIDSESGAQFRDINDALDFKQFVDANRIDPIRDATTPVEKYRAVGERINELDQQAGTHTYVFNDTTELPQGLSEQLEPGYEIDGITWLRESYICAPKIQNAEQARRTYIHEVAGHQNVEYAIRKIADRTALWEAVVDDIGIETLQLWGISELNIEIEKYENGESTKRQVGREAIAYSTEINADLPYFASGKPLSLIIDLNQRITPEVIREILNVANRYDNTRPEIAIANPGREGLLQNVAGTARPSGGRIRTGDTARVENSGSNLSRNESPDPRGKDATGSGVETGNTNDPGTVFRQNNTGADRVEQGTVPTGETVTEDTEADNTRYRESSTDALEQEREAIVSQAQADGTYLKAPNGADTNLTPDQWVTVRTQAFKAWFGDWESNPVEASKVVDKNGEPLVVYHGSRSSGFAEFEDQGYGLFFTDNTDVAAAYSNGVKFSPWGSGDNGMYRCFLNLRNPIVVDAHGKTWDALGHEMNNQTFDSAEEIVNHIKAQNLNYDGVVIHDVEDGDEKRQVGTTYAAIRPNQIKDAYVNQGSFSVNSDDIRYRTTTEANAAQLTPAEVNELFNDELNNLTPENANSTILWLGNPSEALRTAGVVDKPLKLYGNKVIKKMEKHGFALGDLKNLPQAVANPIAVFDNIGRKGNRSILTELQTPQGNVLVAIDLGKGQDVSFNIISSTFGKGKTNIIDWINKGFATYIDTRKALDYLHHPALIAETSNSQGLAENASSTQGPNYLGSGSDESINSATNIIKNFANPTLLDGEKVAAVDALATELKVAVRAIKDVSEIIDSETDAHRKRRNAGWHSRTTGEIAVVLPNCSDVAEVQKTILHEAVGHYGIPELLGRERADALYRQVFEVVKDTPRGRELLAKHQSETVAGDEYMAEMAEGDVTPGAFKRMMAAVRAFFRDALGVNLKLTDADLRYILWRSKHNLQNAKTVSEAMQIIGDDLRMRSRTDHESARERKAAQLEKLRNSELIRITGEEVTSDNDMKQYKKNALEYGKSLRGEYTNKDTGIQILLGRSGILEVLHHDSMDEIHLQSVAAIPRIIENSVRIDTGRNEDMQKHPFVTSYDYYVCGLRISDKDYTVKAVIANTVGGERYYDHKLTSFEKGKLMELVSRITNSGPSTSTPHSIAGSLIGTTPGFNQATSEMDNLIERRDEISSSFTDNEAAFSAIKDRRLLSVLQPEPLAYQPYLTINPAKSEPKTAMEYLDQVEVPDEDIRFREKQEPQQDQDQQQTPPPRMLDNRRKRAAAVLLDKTQAVKNMQNELDGVSTGTDIHAALYRKDSRVRAGMTRYQKKYIEPITKTIVDITKDHGIKPEQTERYLRAKHSLERHDSGTDALAKTGNWTREHIESIVADFEQQVPHGTVEDLWKQVNAANDATLRMLLESGLMTAYDYQNIKAKGWGHYVPLRGWDFEAEGTFDPVKAFTFQQSKGGGGGVEALKKAKGRHSESSKTLATIQHIAFTAIARAEDNIVGLHALRLAREHRNRPDLMQLTSDWYRKSDEGSWIKMSEPPTKEQQDETTMFKRRVIELRNQLPALRRDALNLKASEAQRAESLQKIKDIMETMDSVNERIRYKANDGRIDNRPFTKEQQDEKSIEVFEFGQKYTILFGDPDVANAIRGQRKPGKALKFIGAGTRFLSKAYTALTPEFILANFVRDLQMGGMYHLVDSDGNFKGYMRNVKPAAGSIHRHLAGSANPLTVNEIGNRKLTSAADRAALIEEFSAQRVNDAMYDLFLDNGGETGYIHIDEVEVLEEKLERSIKREIAKSTRTVAGKIIHAPTVGLFRAYMSGIDYLGAMSENTVRFATFMAMMETGKGVVDSTNYAKNVTVNFNIKGSSAQDMGAFFSFFNASIRGTMTIVELGARKGNRKRFAFHAAIMALAGYMLPKLWDLIGWTDDEDEKKEYSQTNFITIPLPSLKRQVKIPVMQGFRAFYGFGALAYLWEKGEITAKEFGAKAAMLVWDNASPIQSPDLLDLTYTGVARVIVPTALVPAFDVATNTNFMGGTIRREPFTTAAARTKPDSELYKRDVHEALRWFTSSLNRLAGGISKLSASVNADMSYSFLGDLMDQNPSNLKHLFYGYTGGTGRFFTNVIGSVTSAIQGEVPDTRNWPILNRFVEDVRPKNYYSDFMDMNNRINDLNNMLKSHVKDDMFDSRLAGSFEELKVRQRAVSKKAKDLKRANDKLKDVWAKMDEQPDGSDGYIRLNKEAQDMMKKALNDHSDALEN